MHLRNLAGFLAVMVAGTAAAAPTTEEMSARYARATAATAPALASLILNAGVAPHWIDGGGFWYRRALKAGGEYRVVQASGAAAAAFDHSRLAAAVSQASGATIGPWALTVTELAPEQWAKVGVDGKIVRCTLTDYRCAAPVAPPKTNTRQALSPDGTQAVFAKDNNLWLKDIASGREKPLTSDGEAYFAWGKLPDSLLLTLVNERHDLPLPPWGASWSPNGRYLVASRLDERPIKPYPFLESVPQDGSFAPIVRTARINLLGEPGATFSAIVFDMVTGKRTSIDLPKGLSVVGMFEIFGWSDDGKRFYVALPGKDRAVDLTEIDAETGAVRAIVTESPKGFFGLNSAIYNAPNVRLIGSGREMLWYSSRSGWGHLYRYDLKTGKLLNAVTRGNWVFRDILHVDEERRQVVFTGSGREPGDPYRRRVYRVNFDGSGLKLLTPEDADHTLEGQATGIVALFFGVPKAASKVSPDGASFVDTWSTPSTPPVTVLRRTVDGGVIARLEAADISGLTGAGWKTPEPFVAKAADGKTDIYGAIWWPDADMGDRVPVIDNLYGGPQLVIAPHSFTASGWNDAFALTRLGFAVVTIDGRGTPLRSRAFQDESFANFGDTAVDDHAAVMKQLVQQYPRLDGDRIGVTGHSYGGYVAARAMLRHADVFKVGVASAGPHVHEAMYDAGAFLPTPDYGDGRKLRPNPTASPANYRAMDNAPLAANLRGRLLLGYGDLDENALPASTLQFIDALIKAGRRYDLVYMPNLTHKFSTGGDYFTLRRWDYFTQHLLGVEPPLPPYRGDASETGL